MVLFKQGECFRVKWMYSCKSGCIRSKGVVFGEEWLYTGRVVEFGQNLLYSGKWWWSSSSASFRLGRRLLHQVESVLVAAPPRMTV